MRLLFVTDRLHVPDDYSGSVQSTHALVQGLSKYGRECEVLASLPGNWKHLAATVVYRLTQRRIILEWRDYQNGYPVLRGSCWRFVERVKRECKRNQPDVLVFDSMRMLRELSSEGFVPECPVIVILHETNFIQGERIVPYGRNTWLVANSPFTSTQILEHFNVEPAIVPPVVYLDDYVTERTESEYVTLITPHKEKGLDLVLGLAQKLPEIPFLLVEGWPMDSAQIEELTSQIRSLPNVKFRRATSNMKDVYRETWVLLVPSVLETFGRVVIEAQSSGIPVLVNDVGALPWVVGDGGYILPLNEDIDDWVERLKCLREDSDLYKAVSCRAKSNILRTDFQPDEVVARFDRLLEKIVT